MSNPSASAPLVAELFAGVGLARLGLEAAGFKVAWANDIETSKHEMYASNFGLDEAARYVVGDIAAVEADAIPSVDLLWASFPCTDLSLAGNREGLAGSGSGTFWHVIRLLREMGQRKPPVVALENVVGFATSHGGDDLTAAIRALNDLDYSVDVVTLDARRFVPQSRARLFVVATTRPVVDHPEPNSELRPDWLQMPFGDPSLRMHRAELPNPPAPLTRGLGKVVEKLPPGDDRWWSSDRIDAFTASLSTLQAQRLDALRQSRTFAYRTAYRRTRGGVPVWEIRADDVSGCLRTARGGSSKQAVVQAGKGIVRVRWMTGREYAALMGAPSFNVGNARDAQILFGFGDAVAVPAVAWLGENYLLPLALGIQKSATRSA